jgi:Ca2+-binding EF-hand superfamily protein
MSSLSIHSGHHQSFADRFKKLDTDSDGKISKDEFVAGAPKGTDSTQASNLYDQLVQAASSSSSSSTSTSSDSSSTGLSASDLQTAFQSLSGSTRQAMFQMQASGQYGPPPPPPSDQSTQDISSSDQTDGTDDSTSTISASGTASSRFHNFFAKLDADGDGKVSKDEFIASAPPGMDSTKAGEFYDKLAKAAASSDTSTSSSDSTSAGLSESDLKTAFDSLRPQGPKLAQAQSQDGTTSINDLLKHISDDLDQILTASNTSSSSSAASSTASAATATTVSSTDTSTDTDSSSTGSTSIADELSVISKQLEKLLAARKTYGMANAGFAPFMGTTTQAAA